MFSHSSSIVYLIVITLFVIGEERHAAVDAAGTVIRNGKPIGRRIQSLRGKKSSKASSSYYEFSQQQPVASHHLGYGKGGKRHGKKGGRGKSKTKRPSTAPSAMPLPNVSNKPSLYPTSLPSLGPTFDPTLLPSYMPSTTPSPHRPSVEHPSSFPSSSPSSKPSAYPDPSPSVHPSSFPSLTPTRITSIPNPIPSYYPSAYPSSSQFPSEIPSIEPSNSLLKPYVTLFESSPNITVVIVDTMKPTSVSLWSILLVMVCGLLLALFLGALVMYCFMSKNHEAFVIRVRRAIDEEKRFICEGQANGTGDDVKDVGRSIGGKENVKGDKGGEYYIEGTRSEGGRGEEGGLRRKDKGCVDKVGSSSTSTIPPKSPTSIVCDFSLPPSITSEINNSTRLHSSSSSIHTIPQQSPTSIASVFPSPPSIISEVNSTHSQSSDDFIGILVQKREGSHISPPPALTTTPGALEKLLQIDGWEAIVEDSRNFK